MQMGVDHDRDVFRAGLRLRESIFESRATLCALVLDSVDLLEFLVFLVAGAGIDEDKPRRMLDEQAPHSELNPVALVGGNSPFPERLRNDAEHRAAVELCPPA